MKRNRKLVLIVALIAAAVYYLLPSVEFYSMADDEREAMELKSPGQLADLKKRSLNLGLDLQGGIHLVLEVKTEEMEEQEAQDAVSATASISLGWPSRLFSAKAKTASSSSCPASKTCNAPKI
ncbi:MAG: hypothetical protein J4F35_10915 [Candidatus Latescibacteria bacterium]|nr:hypothetical protein [Candidatus Latescibacterota bacterium]